MEELAVNKQGVRIYFIDAPVTITGRVTGLNIRSNYIRLDKEICILLNVIAKIEILD